MIETGTATKVKGELASKLTTPNTVHKIRGGAYRRRAWRVKSSVQLSGTESHTSFMRGALTRRLYNSIERAERRRARDAKQMLP